jgi:hypothetical protein
MSVWGGEVRKTPEAKGSSSQPRDWVAKLVAYLQSIQKLVFEREIRDFSQVFRIQFQCSLQSHT